MHKPISRRYWLYGIPVVLLAVPLYFIRARYSLEGQLHYHRSLWAAKPMTHYTYTIEEYPLLYQVRAEVQQGKPPRYTRLKGEDKYIYFRRPKMEDYFKSIEDSIKKLHAGKLASVYVTYDGTYGYPKLFYFGYPCIPPNCGAAPCKGYWTCTDNGAGYRITNFKQLP